MQLNTSWQCGALGGEGVPNKVDTAAIPCGLEGQAWRKPPKNFVASPHRPPPPISRFTCLRKLSLRNRSIQFYGKTQNVGIQRSLDEIGCPWAPPVFYFIYAANCLIASREESMHPAFSNTVAPMENILPGGDTLRARTNLRTE